MSIYKVKGFIQYSICCMYRLKRKVLHEPARSDAGHVPRREPMTYVAQELYQPSTIAIVSGVAQSNPNKKRREETTAKKKAGKGLFAGKLEEESAKLNDREIAYYASGYTKSAMPYRTEVKMKQYS